MVQLTVIASHGTGPRAANPLHDLAENARRLEAQGFDVLSYAQMLNGDVFAPLMEIARVTSSVGLMTRVVGASSRSPVLIASGAAWVDHASGGRFTLGMGAGVVLEYQQYLGITVPKPASHMHDTIAIIRALWGEDSPGVSKAENGWVAYDGSVLQVERATVDLLPSRRIPIVLAAAGPRMLRMAGAYADGVILELTTPKYVGWALSKIREGAASVGRTLPSDFLICAQGSYYDSRNTGDDQRLKNQLYFTMSHCVFEEFRALWEHAGLGDEAKAVRDAANSGDINRAETLVREVIWPKQSIDIADPDTFWRWAEGHVAAGVTMISLPGSFESTFPIKVREVRDHLGTHESGLSRSS